MTVTCIEGPSLTFCNGKYSVLNKFCDCRTFRYYRIENKSNKTCDHPDVNRTGNNTDECSPAANYIDDFPRKISILQSDMNPRSYAPNVLLPPEKFAHYILLLSCPFRDGKELFSGFLAMCQNKMQDQAVHDVLDIN